MKSGEARLGEAIATLTAVLERDGVEDPARKAHDFMTELLREGWRAVAHPAYRPKPGGDRKGHPNTARREAEVAREEIAEGKARFAAREDARRHASQVQELVAAGIDPTEILAQIEGEV